MKLILAAVCAVLTLAGCNQPKDSSKLAGAANPTPSKLLVIDVRTPAEFNSGHIAGAVNVPVNELAQRIPQVAPAKDTLIAVHCQSGGRSARAKKMLDEEGYTKVEDLGSLAHAREVIEGK